MAGLADFAKGLFNTDFDFSNTSAKDLGSGLRTGLGGLVDFASANKDLVGAGLSLYNSINQQDVYNKLANQQFDLQNKYYNLALDEKTTQDEQQEEAQTAFDAGFNQAQQNRQPQSLVQFDTI